MLSITFVFYLLIVTCLFGQEPDKYILSYPTGDNYLNIPIDKNYSNNYFIIIGDWGAAEGPNVILQRKVAKLMEEYISIQTKAGKKLLFFVSVGDNFYLEGTFY